MAGEATTSPRVTGLSWWIANRASRLLEPDERDAVQGDFAELGTTSSRALHDLLGLIARRQIRAWTEWRPWVGFVGLVVPLGMMLSIVSRSWTGAISAWFYVNNWTWAYLDSPGARRDLAHAIGNVCLGYLTLIVWSWTTGFALGSLSRRAIWINGPLFCLVLFGGTLGSTTAGLHNPGNAAVFSLTFYRVALPLIVRTVLIVLPALWGMRNGFRLTTLRVPQAIVCAVLVATLTALTAGSLQVSMIFGWVFPPVGPVIKRGSWPLHLFPLLMVWPAAYILASASWRRGSIQAARPSRDLMPKEGNTS